MSIHINGIKVFNEDPFEVAQSIRYCLETVFACKMDALVNEIFSVFDEVTEETRNLLKGDKVFDCFRVMNLAHMGISMSSTVFDFGYTVHLSPAYHGGVIALVDSFSKDYREALIENNLGKDYYWNNQVGWDENSGVSEEEWNAREEEYAYFLDDTASKCELSITHPTYVDYSTARVEENWRKAGLL